MGGWGDSWGGSVARTEIVEQCSKTEDTARADLFRRGAERAEDAIGRLGQSRPMLSLGRALGGLNVGAAEAAHAPPDAAASGCA